MWGSWECPQFSPICMQLNYFRCDNYRIGRYSVVYDSTLLRKQLIYSTLPTPNTLSIFIYIATHIYLSTLLWILIRPIKFVSKIFPISFSFAIRFPLSSETITSPAIRFFCLPPAKRLFSAAVFSSQLKTENRWQ